MTKEQLKGIKDRFEHRLQHAHGIDCASVAWNLICSTQHDLRTLFVEIERLRRCLIDLLGDIPEDIINEAREEER